MSKLTAESKFLDFSDYGRSFGKLIARRLKNTKTTPNITPKPNKKQSKTNRAL